MSTGKRLVWDVDSERLYETGISNVVLYPWDKSQEKYGGWGIGVAWNGVTAITESPSGAEASDIYADNIKYLSLRSVEQLGATIEAYMYPKAFAECDGSAIFDTTSEQKAKSAGIIVGQQSRKPFCLAYKTVLGNDTEYDDYGYKIHLLYNATASPSERAYNTINDSPEANTFSWELTTNPIPVPGHKNASLITINSRECDKDVLKKIEDNLFGVDSGDNGVEAIDPHILLPGDIQTIIKGSTG